MEEQEELKVKSQAFGMGESIPEKYTCDGEDVNPPLEIENVPAGTQSLALIMDDPDAPIGNFTHWVVFDIPAGKTKIEEGSVPGVEGMNDFSRTSYMGPCPPSGEHRYFINVYALKDTLGLESKAQREKVEKAMKGKAIAKGSLMGKYSKQ